MSFDTLEAVSLFYLISILFFLVYFYSLMLFFLFGLSISNASLAFRNLIPVVLSRLFARAASIENIIKFAIRSGFRPLFYQEFLSFLAALLVEIG